ncbi:MAG: matrixin family metalloprotease [Bryobacterales bacterium]
MSTQKTIRRVQEYLDRYGYFDTLDYAKGKLDSPTRAAINRLRRQKRLAEPQAALESAADGLDSVIEAITRSRCGHPDLDNGVAFSLNCRWPKGTARLTFAFENHSRHMPADTAHNALRRAFQTWSNLPALPFQFEETNSEDSDIVVAWRPSADPDFFMGPGGGINPVAHADFPPACSSHIGPGRPLHFDDEGHLWADGPLNDALDLETVAVHEIGHLLGLRHSSVAGSVVREDVQPGAIRRALHSDDVFGITALYST